MAGYADPTNPTGRLTPPGDYSGDVKKTVDDALGIVHYALSVIDHFTGSNIEAEITNWVGGNYGRLLSIRDSWNCVGWAVGDVGNNLTTGLGTLYGQSGGSSTGPHWSGNAADSFYSYMIDWGAALGEDQQACFTVRDTLTQLAKTAADTLTTIIDAIKEIVSLISAAGASIEIPIWGEYKLGEAVWKAIGLINNVRKVVSAFINTIKLAVATCHEIVDVVNNKNPSVNVNIPAAPYSGPVPAGN